MAPAYGLSTWVPEVPPLDELEVGFALVALAVAVAVALLPVVEPVHATPLSVKLVGSVFVPE